MNSRSWKDASGPDLGRDFRKYVDEGDGKRVEGGDFVVDRGKNLAVACLHFAFFFLL